MKHRVALVAAASIAAVLLLEWLSGASAGAALLPAMTFWSAVCQGMMALVAASVLSNGKWFLPIQARLLRPLPLFLMTPALFLIWSNRISLYGWTAHPTSWLSPGFFISRNFVCLLALFAAAYCFTRSVVRESPHTRILAVVYIFFFVLVESLMAFDWFMSLEAPWVSTLFGGYFFVESFYVGVAFSLLSVAWSAKANREKYLPIQVDLSVLMLSFGIFWGGLLFAQYLTIWYGNIPEEVSYLYRRAVISPYREMSVGVLLLMFILPFVLLIPKATKRSRLWVTVITSSVMLGYLLERIVFILPVCPVNPAICLLEWILLGVPVAVALFGSLPEENSSIPD